MSGSYIKTYGPMSWYGTKLNPDVADEIQDQLEKGKRITVESWMGSIELHGYHNNLRCYRLFVDDPKERRVFEGRPVWKVDKVYLDSTVERTTDPEDWFKDLWRKRVRITIEVLE